MKKHSLFLLAFMALFLLGHSQGQVNTVPPLNGGNGSQGITFRVTSTQPIVVDSLFCTFTTAGLTDVWYTDTDTVGPPNISATTGWTQIGSATVPAGVTGSIAAIPLGIGVTINPGTNYRFFINGNIGAGLAYTTGTAGVSAPFTDGTVTIETGNLIGYGGPAPNPGNHPRQFNGGVKYSIAGPPPVCPRPTNLGAVNPTLDSATIYWTGNPLSTFEYEVVPASAAQGSGNLVVVGVDSLRIGGLSPSTTYKFYVREICSRTDTSLWSGPRTFRTSNGVPFLEDFQLFTSASSSGWSNQRTSAINWLSGTSTSSTGTGPVADHTIGAGGKFLFTETSGATLGTADTLFSAPIFLDPSMNAVTLEFWYHMHGAAMGSLHAGVYANGTYTNLASFVGQQQTAQTDPWLNSTSIIAGYAGQSIQIAFVGVAGSSFTSDMAIDDVRLFIPSPQDGGVSDILSPGSGCGLSTTETVTVEVTNFGTASISNFPISFVLNSGTPVTETYTGSIPSGGVANYTFTATANLATAGTYTLQAYTGVAGDGDITNDSSDIVINSIPILSSFPYTEGFEAGNGGWTAGGANSSWALGTPSGAVINSAAGGTQSWVTSLAGTYNASEVSYVQGPCFDFTNLAAPQFKMNVWWNTESGWDGAVLQSSIDGGSTWQDVGAFGDPNNWYNAINLNGFTGVTPTGQGWAGRVSSSNGSGGWLLAEHDLTGLGGVSGVLLRVLFAADGSVQDDGFAFDNIFVGDAPAADAAALSLVAPISGCGLGSDTVKLQISNAGSSYIVNFPVGYIINGGTPVVETHTDTLHPGDTAIHTFSTLANISATGAYNFIGYTALVGDGNNLNDSTIKVVNNIPILTTFPYTEGFESGNGGWTSGGTNSSWALGTPSGTVINSAAGGTQAWATNLSGLYNASEVSYVQGPCFDFTNLAAPQFKMNVWWNSESSFDGAVLQSSIDGGTTWQDVGAFGDPNNWYNATGLFGFTGVTPTGQGWAGRNSSSNGSAGWLLAEHDLTGLGGVSGVLLRVLFASDPSVQDEGFAFDNIFVGDAPAADAAALRIISPTSGCGLGIDTVKLQISNPGSSYIVNFPVGYAINGGTPVIENYRDTIHPGDTAIYTFSLLANISSVGTYNFDGFTALVGDGNPLNDSTTKVVNNIPILSSYPYIEGFESGNGGWTSGGVNSTWALGTPAKAVINSAAGGTQAWVNGGLTGQYNNSEVSFVQGPCFDFTSLLAPQIKMNVWWNSEFSWDGAVLQTSIDGGTTWQDVGAFGDPNNWYTDNTINGLVGVTTATQGWTGRNSTSNGSGGWVLAEHDLNGLAGVSGVLIRILFGSDTSVPDDGFAFDNIFIGDAPANDVGVDELLSPGSGCASGTFDSVKVSVINYGSAIATNVPVSYSLNGGAPVNESIALINVGDTVIHTFQVPAASPTPGNTSYITSYTALAGDGNVLNDTLSNVAVTNTKQLIPHTEDFDALTSGTSGPTVYANGWESSNVGSYPWRVNTGTTSSTNTGPTSDVSGIGNYMYTEGSSPAIAGAVATLTSSCYDIGTITGNLTLEYYYHMYGVDIVSLTVEMDSAGTWVVVDTLIGQQQTANADTFRLRVITLNSGFAALSTTKVRFKVVRGASFDSDAAIDEVTLIDRPISVQNAKASELQFAVNPNPSNGNFNLNLSALKGKVQMEVRDLSGKTVFIANTINSTNYKLNLEGLSKGVYFLKVTNNNINKVEKLIIN